MTRLIKEIENCRQRWLKAKKSKDEIMANLWEKVGKKLKKQLDGLMENKRKEGK